MEYVPGGSLSSLLHRFGALDEVVITNYTPQILAALAYIHGKGILHRFKHSLSCLLPVLCTFLCRYRDVKGSNVMLMPSGVIKLIDFGCAKRVLSLTKSTEDMRKSMKGTPFWMAPEVLNEAKSGPASDIWSLGCTVVEMGRGKPPWAELGKMAALRAIAGGACPEAPASLSPEAQAFLARCLERDPERRGTAAELLLHPFLAFAPGRRTQERLHDPGSGQLKRKARKPAHSSFPTTT